MSTTTSAKTRIAVLGGGLGSLSTVFHLTSDPSFRETHDITIYQLGWRLGGKCASGRNLRRGARIEEHGVHMFMGFYKNAFAMMQTCYEELNRPPGAPLAQIDQAFKGHNRVTFNDEIEGRSEKWDLTFPPIPGTPADAPDHLSVWHLLVVALEWVHQLTAGGSGKPGCLGGIWHAALLALRLRNAGAGSEADADRDGPAFDRETLARALTHAGHLRDGGTHQKHADPLHDAVSNFRHHARQAVAAHDHASEEAESHTRRLLQLIEIVAAVVRGVVADKVFEHGYDAIDGEDFVDWLMRHGAPRDAAFSAPVRAFYDAMFAYADGDPARPSAAAGTVLHSGLMTFAGYYGHLYYQMQAGMGDVVITPIYEVLKRRGVKFEFFVNVTSLALDDSRSQIETIHIGRQAEIVEGRTEYDPLVPVKDLRSWPDRPLYEQLRDADESLDYELPEVVGKPDKLQRGRDFDLVVLGIPLGAHQTVCAELIAASPAWSDMFDNVKTVATMSVQLWFTRSWSQLGFPNPPASNSGYPEPLSVVANSDDVIPREAWEGEQPRSLTYLCGPLYPLEGLELPISDAAGWDRAKNVVRRAGADWVGKYGNVLWPDGSSGGSLNTGLLYGRGSNAERLSDQYFRPNVTPSELYVQSVPGSAQYRLPADGAGFDNLVLAGDWIDNGFIRAGFVEGTVRSGMQAADAVRAFSASVPP